MRPDGDMKTRLIGLILALFILFVFVSSVEAHPGRTAADGCHYCRTRCDYWGVPWNARHCHGVPPPPLPISTPTPKPKPTATPTPTFTPTPTPTVEPTPMQEPQVMGETESQGSTGDTILGLAILGGMGFGTFWLGRKVWKKLRSQSLKSEDT